MGKWSNILWVTVLTILGVVCFPLNPLVLTGVLEVETYTPLTVIGFISWGFGMVLVMAPIVMFPRWGGVAKRKSYVSTTRLVDTGIYAVVRHPQYTGGIYSIFLATPLLYPHWLFGILGAIGILSLYISCKWEDQRLIEKFGDEYIKYMQRVPRMNVFAGILRLATDKK